MTPTTTITMLTLDGARTVADAALGAALAMRKPVCICITDPSGDVLVSLRMDGAPRLSGGLAAGKASTVARFSGLPTHRLWSAIAEDQQLVIGIGATAEVTAVSGGLPIVVDGAVVGAIGVSGATADEDREIAAAGAGSLTTT